MRLLFVADIMGSPGRRAVREILPSLVGRHHPDIVLANGENSAGGAGITGKIADELFSYGIQVITGGNHSWDNKDGVALLDREPRLLRPHNYPEGNPGGGIASLDLPGGGALKIVNLQGRVFMPPLRCPFRIADQLLAGQEGPVFVDFHAEATSEKAALARYLDGRVTALVGTHTHVQTSDACILDGGSAFLSDAGMTGPHDSVIGMTLDSTLPRFLLQRPSRFAVAKKDIRLQGVLLEFEEKSGRALSICALDEVLKEDA